VALFLIANSFANGTEEFLNGELSTMSNFNSVSLGIFCKEQRGLVSIVKSSSIGLYYSMIVFDYG